MGILTQFAGIGTTAGAPERSNYTFGRPGRSSGKDRFLISIPTRPHFRARWTFR